MAPPWLRDRRCAAVVTLFCGTVLAPGCRVAEAIAAGSHDPVVVSNSSVVNQRHVSGSLGDGEPTYLDLSLSVFDLFSWGRFRPWVHFHAWHAYRVTYSIFALNLAVKACANSPKYSNSCPAPSEGIIGSCSPIDREMDVRSQRVQLLDTANEAPEPERPDRPP